MTAERIAELREMWQVRAQELIEEPDNHGAVGLSYVRPQLLELLDALEAALPDKQRLEFMISVLNEWGMFCDFVSEYLAATRSTSVQRADDAEWRRTIDAARAAIKKEQAHVSD